ncbi:MAG: gamma-glutamyl-gamma-aminobutyrate hydrolase family protein [Acidobacteria bacterium]|nr:gamma-glutamyl-gamma-aminobutyrate hydrolase family protein [Acidobacteriota bacterium]
MPVIAIARCSKLPDYEESVRRAGGDPWVIDHNSDPAPDVIARAGGLLLTGGGDVDPSTYGEPAHPTFSAAEAGRDAYEIDLVRRAIEADLPVLAICRGIQLLNVARGGTLVQDIPSQVAGACPHKLESPAHPPFTLAHDVRIERDSGLARLVAEAGGTVERVQVNSRHHQAVKALGEGLVTAATAPDGVIEAVEDPARRFCLGVQWHPENFYRTGEFRTLFEALVNAATRP